ncbi:MAG: methylmalonyl-CoA mutase [Amphritea sp.]|nr:methylmalonyl-CoA mutase [Amphritea sp.]
MPSHKSFYTAADIAHLEHLHHEPGEAPFIRGPFTEMYRHKPWTIRQYTGFASSVETNRAFKKTLAEGGQGLSLAFDLPTHLGFDSDHPAAQADVGRTGVAIDSVEDMKQLFDGIDLSKVSVSMTMNGAVLPVMAAFIVAAEEQGVSPRQLRGTIQNDILKEFMVRNTYIFEPHSSMRISTDVVEYLHRELPQFNSMSISGYHFKEAGAEPALELALTLANACEYLDTISQRGLDLNRFCPRLSFFFGVGMNFFEEIAKLRAARLLWSQAVEQRGATSAKARRMKMHCQTSGWSLSAQEPENNLMRTTLEAMAAVFGGTQSLHTNSYDEALNLPTPEAARLARNTQLIMQHEAGLCDIADPWGGSYMMENLTHETAQKARSYLALIEQQGGIIAALNSGWVDQQIHKRALQTQSSIDNGQTTIIGVNCYQTRETPGKASAYTVNYDAFKHQQQQLSTLKQSRDPLQVQQALLQLSQAAADNKANLLEATIRAIRTRATLGECTQALLKQFRRHPGNLDFIRHHNNDDQNSHSLDRQRVLTAIRQFRRNHQRAPSILLAKLGLDGHDRGIKVIASNLKQVGFDVELAPLFSSPEQVAMMCRSCQYDALGISLLSGAHLPLMDKLIKAMQQHRTDQQPGIFLGGIIPDQDIEPLTRMGVSKIFKPATPIDSLSLEIIQHLQSAPVGYQQTIQKHR